MLGYIRTSDTSQTGPRCPYIPQPAFFPRISWPKKVQTLVIPALAPTLDRSLKGDRSLCPVRALCYYLDRTLDLRQNKGLVFVSFKKGFDRHFTCHYLLINRLLSSVMSSLTKRPSHYIRLKPMMLGPLLLPRPSSLECPWSKFCQPSTGSHTIPSHNRSTIWPKNEGILYICTYCIYPVHII